jgi:tetratricopeptide (TPR) repeat protein
MDPAGSAARCRAWIAYDPRDAVDRRFVDQALKPAFPQATYQRLPFTGHPVTSFLSETEHLPAWIRARLDDRPPPPLDRRAGRRRSATWHQVMAERCAQRGRLRLAEALVDRSLALRERNMLAHRTRGLVKSLQGDWPEAVAALERALALDPADPLTQALLQRAQRPLAGKPGASPAKVLELLPSAAPAPWWKRAANRLRRTLGQD